MKLTKIKALEECSRIWTALSERICIDKRSVDGALDYIYQCPCCQYVCDRLKYNGLSHGMKKFQCSFCPLKNLWGENQCEGFNSPYALWGRYQYSRAPYNEYAIEAAKEIVDFTDTLLMYLYLMEMNEQ